MQLEREAGGMAVQEIANRLVALTLEFVEQHPVYFEVMDLTSETGPRRMGRNRLGERLAAFFRVKSRITQRVCPAVCKCSRTSY